MKRLTLLFLIAASTAFGQIEVTEIKSQTVEIGRYKYSDFNKGNLSYIIKDADTTIFLMCLDQKYQSLQEYRTISFKGGSKEKDQLYDALVSCYSEANKDNKDYILRMKLGKENVTVYLIGKMVRMSFGIYQFSFTKANIDSLFGKKA